MAKEHSETRNISLAGASSSGRTTIQLEPEAWALVDAVAKARGQNWRDWVEQTINRMTTPMSRSAWIRTQAMAGFYEMVERNKLQQVAHERADAITAGDPFSNPELDSVLGFLDDDSLAENMAQCPVEGAADLGGFILHTGFDEFGRRCFWIENQMKACPSIVISIPKGCDE